MKLRRLLLLVALCCPVVARADDENLFSSGQAELVSDAELAEQRGGFRWQGLDIRLGAEIRSYLGGELVIQTNLNWNDAQAEVLRTVSNALTLADPGQPGAATLEGVANMTFGQDNVFLANQGQTAFIQRAEGALQNIIVNTASNVGIRQELAAQIDVGNFSPFRADVLSERITTDISSMIGSVMLLSQPN
jgi:hypothetical protein